MADKRLKFTRGFCNMLDGYTGGTFSYSYQLSCMLHAEAWKDDTSPRFPLVLDVPEVLWKDLIITMEEVMSHDNKSYHRIARAMLKQLQ